MASSLCGRGSHCLDIHGLRGLPLYLMPGAAVLLSMWLPADGISSLGLSFIVFNRCPKMKLLVIAQRNNKERKKTIIITTELQLKSDLSPRLLATSSSVENKIMDDSDSIVARSTIILKLGIALD